MPAEVMTAPHFLHPPTLHDRPIRSTYYRPRLSLGLIRGLDGQFESFSQTVESELMMKNKMKDDDFESRSGSDNVEGGSCEDQDTEPPRKKRYHRHTPRQIQEMEMLFKECPHPDDKQRQELSRELGLEPRQVKFWFQNRRTQLKTQQERSEISMLRMENEKLRIENITMREAIKNVCCPSCGGPATLGEMTFDEQHLRIENAGLKEELDRLSTLAAKYLGRPVTSIANHQQQPVSSSLDLPVNDSLACHSMDAAASLVSTVADTGLMRSGGFTDSDKPLVAELAVTAMDELWHMCQPEETVWVPCIDGSREVLDYEQYIRKYHQSLGLRPYGFKTEATRETGLVMMTAVSLVEHLLDAARWMNMFPSIISRAFTNDIFSTGVAGNRNGSLQLMYAELQLLSPLVPTREVYFLRYCKQHAEGLWVVADVSIDILRDNLPSSQMSCRRRPSGYLIQDMPDGYSKVTVVEHMEYDDRAVNHMYRSLVNSGMAFGAQRWLTKLQCQCERLTSLHATNISAIDLGGNSESLLFVYKLTSRRLAAIPSASGRRSMMKLAQRMSSNFCAGVSASTMHTWTTLSGTGKDDVRVMTRKSENGPGEPHGIVLSAATSLWLPISPQRVFQFLRDERVRSEWDILSNGGMVQEIAHIAKGQDPGNSVSLLKVNALNSSSCNMLILQESCIDVSGSLVVYAPVDIPAMNAVMQGGDPGGVSLLPSGFAILPDGPARIPLHQEDVRADSCSTGGSLLTVAFQILVSNTPTAKLSLESVATVNSLISCTVQKIKSALQCEHI